MAFKNVGLFENLISFDAGTSTEGKYLGKRVITTKEGDRYNVHSLINPVGTKEEFFGGRVSSENPEGSGALDYLLNQVKVGDIIRVTYMGRSKETIETKYGDKQVHQWKVEVDDGR